jgi:hypothetical protein
MPTFLGRRYMRGVSAVGRAEKAAGAVILLIVAGIIVGFWWQVRATPGGLFAVGPEAYGTNKSRQSQGGRAEVGELPSGGWLPPEPVGGFAPSAGVERFLPDELYVKIDGQAEFYLDLGVRELTFASFVHQKDSQRVIDVYRYDMGSLSNARRAFEAQKPQEARPIDVGDVGYQVAAAVYFCVGPDYVQVVSAGADEQDAAAVRQIAEALAARLGR